jgi:hypothetical protein
VLNLLGDGPEIDACGRFAQQLAGKIPDVLEGLRRGEAESLQALKLPAFRALMVRRLLAVADARLGDWDCKELGDYAQLGLWLLNGMKPDAARKKVKQLQRDAGGSAFAFDQLLNRLPGALQAKDRHGIVAKLEELGLRPLAAQNVEHMLCEFRKLALPERRPRRGEAYAEYAELWRQVQPILASRHGAAERAATQPAAGAASADEEPPRKRLRHGMPVDLTPPSAAQGAAGPAAAVATGQAADSAAFVKLAREAGDSCDEFVRWMNESSERHTPANAFCEQALAQSYRMCLACGF